MGPSTFLALALVALPSGDAAGEPGRHWAFQPVHEPATPQVREAEWCSTPIDRFILKGLESKDLRPSAEADRRTLIRRLHFDLLGLPPTWEEVQAFVQDIAPDAYARLVDRLLASPHYGERWGRHWLDVARYADTKGYVFFEDAEYPWAWTYRDYVIESLNQDLPYDRFILEQLAADQLEPRSLPALRALGFLTLGGRFMNNQQDILDDRIDAVSRGLLGLTVSCARCHDHKYDPILTRDYYSLYGVFANAVEPTIPPLYFDPPQTEAYQAFAKELKAREQKLADFVRTKREQVMSGARTRAAEYLLAAHALESQPSTEEFMLIADGSDLNPRMIRRWQSFLLRTRRNHHPVMAPWHEFARLPEAQIAERVGEVLAELIRPSVERPLNPLIVQTLASQPIRKLEDVARCYGEVFKTVDSAWQAGAAQGASRLQDPSQEEIRQVLYGPDAPANVALLPQGNLDLLPDRPAQEELKKLLKAVEEWRAKGAGAPPRAMALEDVAQPIEQRVFIRGNPGNLGELAPRRFLPILAGQDSPLFTKGSGRLELARAIASPSNPLTARVIVNRLWLHHFGAGLVSTPGDFGLRSDPPSHPELLDYLAAQFMANGWSLKQLHRQILLSATYRQSSRDRPDCRAVDPENRLLWRMNRRPLDFESPRDSLLAVSGRLKHEIGGPSVRHPFLASANRRTLYTYLDRMNVPSLFRTFDFPSPDATSPQRDTTVVAPQALFLMNNDFVSQSAERLLERAEIRRARGVEPRVESVYQLILARLPSEAEVSLALGFLGSEPTEQQWKRYVHALLMSNESATVD